MPVTASKDGIIQTFTCRQWSAMDSGGGWTVLSYDCSGEDASNVRTPFASAAGSGSGTGTTGGDKNYVHLQGPPATSWNITHNLGKYPAVSVVDSSDRIVVGEIEYIDTNNVVLTFSSAFAGKAFLN